jgi:hypothetical protein
MTPRVRQYLFGCIFFAVGLYFSFVNRDFLEGSLFLLAGLAFVVNTLVGEPTLAIYKKVLTAAAWGLIITTGLLFLWVIQFKYL